MHYFFYILRKPSSVRADFGCERTKDVAAKREHTYTQTDRQTDNLSFIYIYIYIYIYISFVKQGDMHTLELID